MSNYPPGVTSKDFDEPAVCEECGKSVIPDHGLFSTETDCKCDRMESDPDGLDDLIESGTIRKYKYGDG